MRTITCLIVALSAPAALAAEPGASDSTIPTAAKDPMSAMSRSVRMEADALRAFVNASGTASPSPGETPAPPRAGNLGTQLSRVQQQLDAGLVNDAYDTLRRSLDENKGALGSMIEQGPRDASRTFIDGWLTALLTRTDELNRSMGAKHGDMESPTTGATPGANPGSYPPGTSGPGTMGTPGKGDVHGHIEAANRLRGEAQQLNANGNVQDAYRQAGQAANELDQAVRSLVGKTTSDPLMPKMDDR